MEKATMNPREAAAYIGCGINRIYELCRRTDFPAIRISEKRIIIPIDHLKEWLTRETEIKH